MLRIIAFTRGGEARIGILWGENHVFDLEKGLTSYLTNELGVNPSDAYRIASTLVPSGVSRLIERWRFLENMIQKVIDAHLSWRLEELLERNLVHSFSEIRFLPAVNDPGKIIGIGLNYDEYRVMLNYPKPEVPLFFFKPANTLIGHEDYVVIPRGGRWPGTESKCLFHEFEMAVVIGKKTRNIDRSRAMDSIFGVTIFSDITAHDIEMIKPGFVLYQQRAKAFDTFSPVGPWIVTMDEVRERNIDLHNLRIARRRNGNIEGESNTRNMIYKIPEIIEFLSEIMTLMPGDIVSLGSPPAGPEEGLQPGDTIETYIESIGILRNYVK